MALIIGIIGAFICLFAFILNQTGKLSADSFTYDFLNTICSLFLLIYALDIMSWPFIITNTIWGLFSLMGVVQYLSSQGKSKRKRRR